MYRNGQANQQTQPQPQRPNGMYGNQGQQAQQQSQRGNGMYGRPAIAQQVAEALPPPAVGGQGAQPVSQAQGTGPLTPVASGIGQPIQAPEGVAPVGVMQPLLAPPTLPAPSVLNGIPAAGPSAGPFAAGAFAPQDLPSQQISGPRSSKTVR